MFFETLERLVAADTDNRNDVYESASGVTSLVSTGPAGGNGAVDAFFYGASADGASVLFGTSERLTAADTDSASDVYERANGATTLVSTGSTGGNGPQGAFFDGVSADGARVFFHTAERLTAGDTDSQADVYERAGWRHVAGLDRIVGRQRRLPRVLRRRLRGRDARVLRHRRAAAERRHGLRAGRV